MLNLENFIAFKLKDSSMPNYFLVSHSYFKDFWKKYESLNSEYDNYLEGYCATETAPKKLSIIKKTKLKFSQFKTTPFYPNQENFTIEKPWSSRDIELPPMKD